MSAPRKPVIGLALGAGGARGWCHIGVIRELEAMGIVPDLVAGTSMGAVVGAAWAANRLDALEDWVAALNRRRYLRLLDPHPFSGGLVAARGLEAMQAEIGVPDRIEDFARPFAAVATDMSRGREIWLREGPAHRAVRASAGIPGVMTPVWHAGHWLLDGGVINPVPVSVARAMGADVIIAVDPDAEVTGAALQPRPPIDRQSKSSLVHEVTTRLFRSESGSAPAGEEAPPEPPEPPGYFEVVMAATSIMGAFIRRSRMAGEPPHVLLSARLGHMSVFDLHESAGPIAEGRRMARESAELIRSACRTGG